MQLVFAFGRRQKEEFRRNRTREQKYNFGTRPRGTQHFQNDTSSRILPQMFGFWIDLTCGPHLKCRPPPLPLFPNILAHFSVKGMPPNSRLKLLRRGSSSTQRIVFPRSAALDSRPAKAIRLCTWTLKLPTRNHPKMSIQYALFVDPADLFSSGIDPEGSWQADRPTPNLFKPNQSSTTETSPFWLAFG